MAGEEAVNTGRGPRANDFQRYMNSEILLNFCLYPFKDSSHTSNLYRPLRAKVIRFFALIFPYFFLIFIRPTLAIYHYYILTVKELSLISKSIVISIHYENSSSHHFRCPGFDCICYRWSHAFPSSFPADIISMTGAVLLLSLALETPIIIVALINRVALAGPASV
jgi:hypothetical protein